MKCTQCKEGFALEEGFCVYLMDKLLVKTYAVLGVILGLLLILGAK